MKLSLTGLWRFMGTQITLSKTGLFLLIANIIIGFTNVIAAKNFIIQEASFDTLEQIMNIDKEVTFEHFLSMYPLVFAGSWMGNNPQEGLTQEIHDDREKFEKAIGHEDNSRLLTAFDAENKTPIGFLFFSKVTEDTMELELFLVLKEYRSQGAGKQLVAAAINYFDTIKQCYVDPHRNHNEATLKFYEKMGFVNQGPTPRQIMLPGGVLTSDVFDRWVYEIKK